MITEHRAMRMLECSCGNWRSELGESDHMAMAGFAAHVHVAEGLAVPDDPTGPQQWDGRIFGASRPEYER